MKNAINQMAHGISDIYGTNGAKLNANNAINASCAMCQTLISRNGKTPIRFRKRQ